MLDSVHFLKCIWYDFLGVKSTPIFMWSVLFKVSVDIWDRIRDFLNIGLVRWQLERFGRSTGERYVITKATNHPKTGVKPTPKRRVYQIYFKQYLA